MKKHFHCKESWGWDSAQETPAGTELGSLNTHFSANRWCPTDSGCPEALLDCRKRINCDLSVTLKTIDVRLLAMHLVLAVDRRNTMPGSLTQCKIPPPQYCYILSFLVLEPSKYQPILLGMRMWKAAQPSSTLVTQQKITFSNSTDFSQNRVRII